MASATIVAVWQDASNIHASARVAEGGAQGNVEYHAVVPIDEAWAAMDAATKKATVIAALKAVRDAQQAVVSVVAGISGSVTL